MPPWGGPAPIARVRAASVRLAREATPRALARQRPPAVAPALAKRPRGWPSRCCAVRAGFPAQAAGQPTVRPAPSPHVSRRGARGREADLELKTQRSQRVLLVRFVSKQARLD